MRHIFCRCQGGGGKTYSTIHWIPFTHCRLTSLQIICQIPLEIIGLIFERSEYSDNYGFEYFRNWYFYQAELLTLLKDPFIPSITQRQRCHNSAMLRYYTHWRLGLQPIFERLYCFQFWAWAVWLLSILSGYCTQTSVQFIKTTIQTLHFNMAPHTCNTLTMLAPSDLSKTNIKLSRTSFWKKEEKYRLLMI